MGHELEEKKKKSTHGRFGDGRDESGAGIHDDVWRFAFALGQVSETTAKRFEKKKKKGSKATKCVLQTRWTPGESLTTRSGGT